MKLLINGSMAFPEIIKCIREAQKNIFINMFIWRADNIGKKISEELLSAADRGVQIQISVDRYGFILERCEECTHSFFHENPTLTEKIKISAMKTLYPTLALNSPPQPTHYKLLHMMRTHKNILISENIFKADHSKYYIFDEKIIILGGINIEDKENGKDISGRIYSDYMVKIDGADFIEKFRLKLEKNFFEKSDINFTVNNKNIRPYCFEAENTLLSVIREAEKKLLIIMAYFSPLPAFLEAIQNAWKKNVHITVVIPEYANFQNDLNRKTAKKIMKSCHNGISLYFYKGMIHTKLIMNEKTLTLGSSNITKKAFKQLSELNITVKKDHSDFFEDLESSINDTIANCIKIEKDSDINYRSKVAFIENLFV